MKVCILIRCHIRLACDDYIDRWVLDTFIQEIKREGELISYTSAFTIRKSIYINQLAYQNNEKNAGHPNALFIVAVSISSAGVLFLCGIHVVLP